MEITEQRRLKEEAASRETELKTKPPENKLVPVTDTPQKIEEIKRFSSEPSDPIVKEEKVNAYKSSNPIPANAITGFLALILSLITFFFIVSSKFLEFWVVALVAKLNALIVHGSFFVLSIIQGACTLEGPILNTYYYKTSLQGDLVAFYSLELLIILAALFAFLKKTACIKKGVVLISLIPLAIIANIFRVVVAFGLALNYGAACADRYFHGVLVGFVFILIILGLILLESLFFSD